MRAADPSAARSQMIPLSAWLLLVATACAPASRLPMDGTSLPGSTSAVEVVDGDGLVDPGGDRYRLIGINAPDTGECLADQARSRLAELVEGEATLRPGEVEPFDQFGRHLVYVFKDQSRPEVFVNQVLVEEGIALAIHSPPNTRHTDELFAAQEQARGAGAGLWSPHTCGSGPLDPIEVGEVMVDPPGRDEEALTEEWVEVVNAGDDAVDLSGWSIRDESTRNRFFFPSGMTLAGGERVTVTSGGGDLGFGLGSPIWNNDGDTVYVVDDQGRFVAYAGVGVDGSALR